jgi:hypothetical protein
MGNNFSIKKETGNKFSIKTSVFKSENVNLKVRDGYYKNQKGIFYNGIKLPLTKSERNTFKKLKYGYAKTKSFIFYQGEIIPEANPQTFIVINRKNMPEEYKNLNSVIGMDFNNSMKHIYQFGKLKI